MVARKRGFDGAPFWGCSNFPACRGTREAVGGASDLGLATVPGAQTKAARSRGIHLDRVVLACGAVGLVIGLGFIVVGLTSGPGIYAAIGAADLFLMALPVLLSPWLRRGYARSAAFKIACFIVFTTLMLILLVPISRVVGQYLADMIMRAIPTHSPAIPSTH
jgi:hypothetical protein